MVLANSSTIKVLIKWSKRYSAGTKSFYLISMLRQRYVKQNESFGK